MKKVNTNNFDDNENKDYGSDGDMIYSFKMIPVNEAFVDKMIEEIKALPITNPKDRTLHKWRMTKGFSESTYYNLLKRHKELKQAHDDFYGMVADKLHARATDNKANWNAVKFVLPRYSKRYAEDAQYWEKIKVQQEADANLKAMLSHTVLQVKDTGIPHVNEGKKNHELE